MKSLLITTAAVALMAFGAAAGEPRCTFDGFNDKDESLTVVGQNHLGQDINCFGNPVTVTAYVYEPGNRQEQPESEPEPEAAPEPEPEPEPEPDNGKEY